MRFALTTFLAFTLLLGGCDVQPKDVSAVGIPSATPFQPGLENGSDSLYADSAPTPLNLPTLTPAPPTPTPVLILPETLPDEVDVPAFTLPTNLNPLTGLPPSDPALLERRPMAIKVANYPRYIRPQSGLTLADQVFEYYIEGGLTRNIAIFYGNDSDWVGPVRSGRFFDENIARMYQAYLVFKFADPRVLSYFETTDIADFLVVPTNGSCPPFRLMTTRQIEVYNNSYFNTLLWDGCIAENGLRNDRPAIRNGFFSDTVLQSADLPGTKVYTYYSDYSYNYWEYVPGTGEYVRYQETDDMRNGKEEKYEPLMDNVTSEQVHAANVVVLFAYHTFANPFNQEDEVYNIDLTGSGEAYVFRDGEAFVARWYRTNKNQPLLLAGMNGTPINMRPGITFYEVIGTNSFASQGDGEWFFHHATP
ncbi:MAG: hypothetical protein C3F07_05495 [Anaerolineales bacterium]|nr:MAG: hypothetical protein C3F07_05495 [Anaerolineales bacterium]